MNITADHWLDTAVRRPVVGGSAMNVRRFLVWHFTSGATAVSSINYWNSTAANGACAHVVIDRDGTIYQCRPFNKTCGHAGVSKWQGFSGLNSCAIGIELANAGDETSLAKRWTKLPLVRARHRNGGPVQEWEAYPPAQLAACEALSKVLVKRYNLDDGIGHEDVAPARKNDPGPAFPMQAMREACGFKGMPKP
jgi:N-acetylmuramoyl-L-alanine amidase